MLIFLYGTDTYRSRKKLNELIERYKKIHKTGLNFKFFDLKEKNFQDFREVFRIKSMFKEKKLLILENASVNKDFQEKFLAVKKDFLNSEDIILFYESKNISRDKFFNFLKNNAKCQEFQPLNSQKLKDWAKNEFEKIGARINPKALEELIDFAGNDLWRLSNEIKKLAAFRKNGIIETKDIELLTRPNIETDIFKTIDAIAQKNKKQALKLISEHLGKGDSPLYLLSMINYQFRNLLVVKDLVEKHKQYDVILKKSGFHPFVVKKSYFQCRKFSFQELKKIYQKIFQIDFQIKTGKIDPQIALDLFILEI